MKERRKAAPASYLILKKGNEILLMHRVNTGYYDGWYGVPAGHIEAGELPIQALIREAKEEIGIDLKETDIRLVHTMYRTKLDETGDRADYFLQLMRGMGNSKIASCTNATRFAGSLWTISLKHDALRPGSNRVRGQKHTILRAGLDRVHKNPSA